MTLPPQDLGRGAGQVRPSVALVLAFALAAGPALPAQAQALPADPADGAALAEDRLPGPPMAVACLGWMKEAVAMASDCGTWPRPFTQGRIAVALASGPRLEVHVPLGDPRLAAGMADTDVRVAAEAVRLLGEQAAALPGLPAAASDAVRIAAASNAASLVDALQLPPQRAAGRSGPDDVDGDGTSNEDEVDIGSHPLHAASRPETDDDANGLPNNHPYNVGGPRLVCNGSFGYLYHSECKGYGEPNRKVRSRPVQAFHYLDEEALWVWDAICFPGAAGDYAGCQDGAYLLDRAPYQGDFADDGFGWRQVANRGMLEVRVTVVAPCAAGPPPDDDGDGIVSVDVCDVTYALSPDGTVRTEVAGRRAVLGDPDDSNPDTPIPGMRRHDGRAAEMDGGNDGEALYGFGDSITVAACPTCVGDFGLPQGRGSFVYQLRDRYLPDATADHNLDGSGKGTAWARATIGAKLPPAGSPNEVFLLEFIVNDHVNGGAAEADALARLAEMMALVDARGATPLWLNAIGYAAPGEPCTGFSKDLTYEGQAARMARIEAFGAGLGYQVVPIADALDTRPFDGRFEAWNPGYTFDCIHPGLRGHAMLADLVGAYVTGSTVAWSASGADLRADVRYNHTVFRTLPAGIDPVTVGVYDLTERRAVAHLIAAGTLQFSGQRGHAYLVGPTAAARGPTAPGGPETGACEARWSEYIDPGSFDAAEAPGPAAGVTVTGMELRHGVRPDCSVGPDFTSQRIVVERSTSSVASGGTLGVPDQPGWAALADVDDASGLVLVLVAAAGQVGLAPLREDVLDAVLQVLARDADHAAGAAEVLVELLERLGVGEVAVDDGEGLLPLDEVLHVADLLGEGLLR